MATRKHKKQYTFKVDSTGRITLPKSLRLNPGDIVSIDGVIEKVKNSDKEPTPEQMKDLDALAEYAIKENRAGRTTSLDDVIVEPQSQRMTEEDWEESLRRAEEDIKAGRVYDLKNPDDLENLIDET